MEERNRSYRIRTAVNTAAESSNIQVNLEQDYDTFEILSLKLSDEDTFKLHNADYGVVVGRVVANGGFGVPNAKISIFIETDSDLNTTEETALYPFTTTNGKGMDNKRYNLLPNEKVNDCHQAVGSFPSKTYLLDNDVLIEVFDRYYKYTTRTNNSGDYMICGVPTGNHTIHMDLDLSDCGILSQRPRDFVYKGYTIEQFENPNQFKTDDDHRSLSQIFSQDQLVNVIPFWGNEELGETIGISRADIEVNFKFEPTCVFIGSVISDAASNGISKKCVPTNQMGAMDELTTGQGYIEMIRKTPAGDTEEFQVKGTQVIDSNGVWCYQIPMNLDYMMTDEYGNMVPTDDPEKGIPTRTRVRFRLSMNDFENNDSYFRGKMLIPHNPQDYLDKNGHEEYDYNFGTSTRDDSYRDLFWNNVYTVKSYIPRFQQSQSWRSERFSGIKHCNIYGQNNPLPYNNIRIKLPLMFMILCALIKSYIRIVKFANDFFNAIITILVGLGHRKRVTENKPTYLTLADGLCPDLEGWYFAPAANPTTQQAIKSRNIPILQYTFEALAAYDKTPDKNSVDSANAGEESICLTTNTDYLISCIEMNLAQEYKVINFDFYNDWVNGVVYLPRWMREIKPKRTWLFGLIKIKEKIKACVASDSDGYTRYNGKTRYYMQQCALTYSWRSGKGFTKITTPNGCVENKKEKQKCHLANGKKYVNIFGQTNGGVIRQTVTSRDQYVYYYKPCEWSSLGKRTLLYATDLVLLGSLEDCNLYGIPQAFKGMTSSSYKMPTNLALTNMDEEGYLYTTPEGTICTGYKNLDTEGLNNPGVSGMSYRAIATYTANANGITTEKITYGKRDENGEYPYNDDIPTTEAAGIAWNYTGPGQGTKDENTKQGLYMPGGHFLGISCTNSETNIKSCVNLQRICEMGTSMSQRREVVRNVNETGATYSYFIPTGLISTDDITDANFRSMFATLNMKRLLADTTDKNTGYPIYSFIYNRPNGFDGSLASKIGGNYNNITTTEKQTLCADTQYVWSQGASSVYTQEMKNMAIDEINNLHRKTLESSNKDYYLFRLGLTENDLKNQEVNNKKFAIINGTYASLPQYENSFYFYFGLKDGSTALDEFYKQFFSVCAVDKKGKNPSAVFSMSDFNGCTNTGTLNAAIKNMAELTSIKVTNIETGEKLFDTSTTSRSGGASRNTGNTSRTTGTAKLTINKSSFTITNLKAGKYSFVIIDIEGKTFETAYDFKDDKVAEYIDGSINTYNFSEKTKDIPGTGFTHYQNVINKVIEDDFGFGGHIDLTGNYVISDEESEDVRPLTGDSIYFLIKDSNNYFITNYTGSLIDSSVIPSSLWATQKLSLQNVITDNTRKIAVWTPSEYKIYFGRVCTYGGQSTLVFKYFDTLKLTGKDGLDLVLGDRLASYYDVLNCLPTNWWKLPESTIYTMLNTKTGSEVMAKKILWILKHYTFRQNVLEDTFNSSIAAFDDDGSLGAGTILFGQPETKNSLIPNGVAVPSVPIYNENEYTYYLGHQLDDTESYHNTESYTGVTKQCFGKMVYSTDTDEYVSNGYPVKITGISKTDKIWEIKLQDTGYYSTNKFRQNHGCCLYIDGIMDIYPVVSSPLTTLKATITEEMKDFDLTELSGLYPLNATIYPLFYYPVIDNPFWCEMNFSVINDNAIKTNYITNSRTSSGSRVIVRSGGNGSIALGRTEYRYVEGTIHNGITYPYNTTNRGSSETATGPYTFNKDSRINGLPLVTTASRTTNYKIKRGTTTSDYVNEFNQIFSDNKIEFGKTSDSLFITTAETLTNENFTYDIIEGCYPGYLANTVYGTELAEINADIKYPFPEIQYINKEGYWHYSVEEGNEKPEALTFKVVDMSANNPKSIFSAVTVNKEIQFEVGAEMSSTSVKEKMYNFIADINGSIEMVTARLGVYSMSGRQATLKLVLNSDSLGEDLIIYNLENKIPINPFIKTGIYEAIYNYYVFRELGYRATEDEIGYFHSFLNDFDTTGEAWKYYEDMITGGTLFEKDFVKNCIKNYDDKLYIKFAKNFTFGNPDWPWVNMLGIFNRSSQTINPYTGEDKIAESDNKFVMAKYITTGDDGKSKIQILKLYN